MFVLIWYVPVKYVVIYFFSKIFVNKTLRNDTQSLACRSFGHCVAISVHPNYWMRLYDFQNNPVFLKVVFLFYYNCLQNLSTIFGCIDTINNFKPHKQPQTHENHVSSQNRITVSNKQNHAAGEKVKKKLCFIKF